MPEHSGFLMRIGDRLGSILLERHLQPVEALDFGNSIQREDQDGRTLWKLERPIVMPQEHMMAMTSERQLIYLFELGVQYYCVFKPRDYTELFIVHEVEDTENVTDQEKKRYEEILERFLTAYRGFSGDVSVRMPNDLIGDYPVICAGLHEYTEEELRTPEPERITRLRNLGIGVEAVPFGVNPHVLRPPGIDPERVGPIIQRFLASGDSIPEPQAMLVKALEELKIGQDYRYALLLGFFAIEQVVTEVLKDVKRSAGISEETIRSYEGEIGMSYKLSVEVPLAFRPEHPVRRLIPELKGANTLRNGVVHKGRTVTYRDAASVIEAADRLIKALANDAEARPDARPNALEATAPPAPLE